MPWWSALIAPLVRQCAICLVAEFSTSHPTNTVYSQLTTLECFDSVFDGLHLAEFDRMECRGGGMLDAAAARIMTTSIAVCLTVQTFPHVLRGVINIGHLSVCRESALL